MASVCRFLTTRASAQGQRIEECGGSSGERKFLGFTISNDAEPTRQIAAKALEKFKERVRELTCRTLGVSLPQIDRASARYLIGWRGYFGFCQTPIVLRNLDAWIRRRLRMYIWRQWKNGRTRFTQLRRLGVSHFHAAVAAGSGSGFWRMARHVTVQQALPNAYFDSIGLPRLGGTANRLTRSNRRGTDPYARWCGRGGAARLPPIPIFGQVAPKSMLNDASAFPDSRRSSMVADSFFPEPVRSFSGVRCSLQRRMSDRLRPQLQTCTECPSVDHHFSTHGRSTTSNAQVDRCWRCSCR